MPIFIDGHNMKGQITEQVKKIVNNPSDKHGVNLQEILYNEKENKLFCILDAPNKESVEKYHQDMEIKCDFIYEISKAKTESLMRTQRLCAIGELSSRLAHDLRNPLGIIKNAVELIEMSSIYNTDEKLQKRIGMIKNATERMLRQISDVLDFVRTRPLQLEKNSLSTVLESSLKSIIPKSIKITKPNNDVSIMCDSKYLELVFGNIITNAIQAMEKSGEIKVRFIENKKFVKIEIEDTGPGIPDDKREQIFEPLYTTKPSGTGLGLVTCKNIVEQHGGKISFRNNPTIFEIDLPKK